MKPKPPANRPPVVTERPYASALYGPIKCLTLILLFLAGIPLTSHADCDVTLRWDANNSAPEGYQLYGRVKGQYYDDDNPWWQGDSTFTQCTIDGLSENKIYFFVVRAFIGENMSNNSNEVRYACGGNDNVRTTGSGSGSGCFVQLIFR